MISDCKVIIASQIDSEIIDKLLSHKIEPYTTFIFIEEALEEISKLKKDFEENSHEISIFYKKISERNF